MEIGKEKGMICIHSCFGESESFPFVFFSNGTSLHYLMNFLYWLVDLLHSILYFWYYSFSIPNHSFYYNIQTYINF